MEEPKGHDENSRVEIHHEEDGEGWLVSYADMMTLLVGFFVVLQSFSTIDQSTFEKVKKETTMLFGGNYKKPFEEVENSLKKVILEKNLMDQVMIHTNESGVDITFKGALFFDSGSTELKAEAVSLLKQLIPVIIEKASGFGVVIEGHTDSNPINSIDSIISSNWELSSIRACRVLRLFEENGFNSKLMKALGWGDTKPIFPEFSADGDVLPENQAQNRRVVIKILRQMEN